LLAVHVDVLTCDLAQRVDGHDVQHLDARRERTSVRLGERQDHRPFEDPVVFAVQQALGRVGEIERCEQPGAVAAQRIAALDRLRPVVEPEDRILRVERGDQVGIPRLPADMIALEDRRERRCLCNLCSD
jgi:hypothetical protein